MYFRPEVATSISPAGMHVTGAEPPVPAVPLVPPLLLPPVATGAPAAPPSAAPAAPVVSAPASPLLRPEPPLPALSPPLGASPASPLAPAPPEVPAESDEQAFATSAQPNTSPDTHFKFDMRPLLHEGTGAAMPRAGAQVSSLKLPASTSSGFCSGARGSVRPRHQKSTALPSCRTRKRRKCLKPG